MFPWSHDAAFLAAFITNILSKEGAQPAKVADFMPADIEPIDAIQQTWDNLRKLSEAPHG